jgi:hypothetical protein
MRKIALAAAGLVAAIAVTLGGAVAADAAPAHHAPVAAAYVNGI